MTLKISSKGKRSGVCRPISNAGRERGCSEWSRRRYSLISGYHLPTGWKLYAETGKVSIASGSTTNGGYASSGQIWARWILKSQTTTEEETYDRY